MLRRLVISVVLVLLCSCATSVQFPSHSPYPGQLGAEVTGLIFKPNSPGSHAAVVLLHTCGGLTPHVTGDWPNFLTELGYVVLTIDSYGPRGASKCTDLIGGTGMQADDAYGALDYLAGLPFVDGDRVGVMGFSAGALAINHHIVGRYVQKGGRNFRAAIALYGRCHGIGDYTGNSIPLMEIIAENDSRHASSCIDRGKIYPGLKVHVLEGAYHAFDQHRSGVKTGPYGEIM